LTIHIIITILEILPNNVTRLICCSYCYFMSHDLTLFQLFVFVSLSVFLKEILLTSIISFLVFKCDKAIDWSKHFMLVICHKCILLFTNKLLNFFINFLNILEFCVANCISSFNQKLDEVAIFVTKGYTCNLNRIFIIIV